MQKYGVALHMPSSDRIDEIVKFASMLHCGEHLTDESLEKLKAEIFAFIIAESYTTFNPVHG